jgi:membrane protease YdiL (CAAX protease family)
VYSDAFVRAAENTQSRWRLVKTAAVRLALLAGGMFALLIALQLGVHALGRLAPVRIKPTVQVILELAACALLILAYRRAVRLIEHRVATEIAFSKSAGWFFPGAILGFAIFCVLYLILWATGVAHYSGLGEWTGVAVPGAAALAAAVGEEIVFRGALFRILDERWGSTVATLVSAAIFGLLHALNPGATLVSTMAIALEAGVLLAAAYAAARTLWLPIGLHFGWNFTEGGIFGAAVSGGRSKSVFEFALRGPDVYTGGTFGPEASVWAVAVGLATSALLIWAAVRLGRWRPFRRA